MRRRVHLGPAAVVVVTLLAVLVAGCGAKVTTSTTLDGGGSTTAGASSPTSSMPGSSASETSTSTATSTPTTSSSSASTGGPTGPPTVALRVSPTEGHPGSTISFSFVAPAASAGGGGMRSSWSLSVVGPSKAAGCVARYALPLPAVHPGKSVSASLGPQQLGGHWCVGSYVARVDELERPRCAAGEMCPQFIRLVAVAGPARFRIVP